MSMNKIILLGRPTSGLHQVESLLLKSGMQAALPSERDGLLPRAVVEIMCQAHQPPQFDRPVRTAILVSGKGKFVSQRKMSRR